jgi:carbamate kinase
MNSLIIALGGNALIKSHQKGTVKEQFRNLSVPLSQVARLSRKLNIVITHGNGPQVGDLLLQQEACKGVPRHPLEILVAQTQGWIGYMIEQTLDNALMKSGITYPLISTVLTYVQVDENDPAFKRPTKPIGPVYARKRRGCVKTDRGWRKVVPSPLPVKIIEWREIKTLIEKHFIVIACGGGGIPVTREHRKFEGIEAVVDKDLASAKLGEQIEAEILVIATDVKKAAINFKKPGQKYLDVISVSQAQKYLKEKQFGTGSMAPKIQACINFLEAGGKMAVITSVDKIEKALEGKAGTRVVI